MALRPLLLASVVGIAALGAGLSPAAHARGYVSISVGTPAPYYGSQYRYGDRHGHQRPRAGHVWVPAHWVSTHRGRFWVPGQYVRVHGYRHPDRGHGGYNGYNRYNGPDTRVIHRTAPGHIVPRSYYPPGYLSPFDDRPRRGW